MNSGIRKPSPDKMFRTICGNILFMYTGFLASYFGYGFLTVIGLSFLVEYITRGLLLLNQKFWDWKFRKENLERMK